MPAKLLTLQNEGDPVFRTGKVSFGGNALTISLALLPEATPGDYVLVHAGVAISLISEKEAQEVFKFLSSTGDLDELNSQELNQ
ncbi:HypC/HybG/HupF family hydrogenase formation chaperone [Pontibacter sp. CAU 1760]